MRVDYLVISGNPSIRIADLLQVYQPGLLIMDSSNSDWKMEQWLKECRERKVPCYSVKKQTAFVATI